MAEKFGLGAGPHELKIGNSFCSKTGGGKFHTIRYDFKPASVDKSKMGVVEVGESNSVTVSVPHSNGHSETNYNGHVKGSSQKECVLIIDRETGEITLEKLSGHMLLKKTRPERPEKNSSNPVPTSTSRPQTPVHSKPRDSPASTPKATSRSASPRIQPSNGFEPVKPTLTQVASKADVDLSDSSSDSSSSGSDTDDSDLETVPAISASASSQKQAHVPPVRAEHPSMPMFGDVAESAPPVTPSSLSQKSATQFLDDDLQLSESEDDSDSDSDD